AGGDPDHEGGHGGRGAQGDGVAEAVDPTVVRRDPVAPTGGGGGEPHHPALGAVLGRGVAGRHGVAIGHHHAIGPQDPVPGARGGGGHGHAGAVALGAAQPPEEQRVTEGDRGPPGREQPVAVPGERRHEVDDRCRRGHDTAVGDVVAGGVAEGQDGAVGGRQPVAGAGRRGGQGHRRRRQPALGVAEGGGVAERRHRAVGPQQPSAGATGHDRQVDGGGADREGPGARLGDSERDRCPVRNGGAVGGGGGGGHGLDVSVDRAAGGGAQGQRRSRRGGRPRRGDGGSQPDGGEPGGEDGGEDGGGAAKGRAGAHRDQAPFDSGPDPGRRLDSGTGTTGPALPSPNLRIRHGARHDDPVTIVWRRSTCTLPYSMAV